MNNQHFKINQNNKISDDELRIGETEKVNRMQETKEWKNQTPATHLVQSQLMKV